MPNSSSWEQSFNQICDRLFSKIKSNEYFIIQLKAEKSHFIRFNNAKVRQTGIVIDAKVSLRLIENQRTNSANFPLTGDVTTDIETAIENCDYLRQEISILPEDPYIVLPQNQGTSHEVYKGKLLDEESAVEKILTPAQGIDFTGFYAGGDIIRANYNSLGQKTSALVAVCDVPCKLRNSNDQF